MRRSDSSTRLLALAVLAGLAGAVVPAGGAAAQAIDGRVVAHATGAPIRGADLILLDTLDRAVAAAVSDADGGFRIEAPGPGTWRLAAQLIGYRTVLSDPLDVDTGDEVTVDVRLTVKAIEIDEPIVVTSRGSYLDPNAREFHARRVRGEKTGIGEFLHGEALDVASATVPSDLLRRVHGVRVGAGRNQQGRIIQMGGGCVPAIFVNGSQINQFRRNQSVDDVVSVHDIEGIEVYRGIKQPGGRFYDREGCGVVLVWTRAGERTPGPFTWKRLLLGMGLVAAVFFIQ
jgi:hypothetical protein